MIRNNSFFLCFNVVRKITHTNVFTFIKSKIEIPDKIRLIKSLRKVKIKFSIGLFEFKGFVI